MKIINATSIQHLVQSAQAERERTRLSVSASGGMVSAGGDEGVRVEV